MTRTPRNRSRSFNSTIMYYNQFGDNFFTSHPLTETEVFSDFLSDGRVFNPCFHLSMVKPEFGLVRSEFGHNHVHTHHVPFYPISVHRQFANLLFDRAVNELNVQLDFQKNNDFQLLNLIGELDDTIAMFTLKFWKSLSYGAFNWGILPFVSDLKSLHSSLSDVFDGGVLSAIEKFNSTETSRYRIELSGSSQTYLGYTYIFKGVLTLHGFHSVEVPSSPTSALQIFIDELGVHPDLRTIWDLIPLSFVLDYFLPVGDLLESIHPRGWFRPNFSFQGNASLKGRLYVTSPSSISFSLHEFPLESISEVYIRREKVVSDLSYRDLGLPNDYKFGLSLRQLFNLGYLSKDFLKALL